MRPMVQPDRKTMVIEHVSSQSRPVAVLPDDEDVLSPFDPVFLRMGRNGALGRGRASVWANRCSL
jgi:hypothetical protein